MQSRKSKAGVSLRLCSSASLREKFAQVALCLCLFLTFGDTVGQKLGSQSQTRPSPRPSFNYSNFSHSTSKHQQSCNSCHKIPSANWQKARDFPDITDYPGHDACVGCHRAQFFKGARPVICSVCHAKTSPRDDARFAFRKPDSTRQFDIDFPHDKHQDVIARLRQYPSHSSGRFIRVSVKPSADDQTKTYNNCSICHVARSKAPLPPAAGWTDNFVPEAGAFKSAPTGHASCFNCHWKSQQPVNNECGGCHKLLPAPLPVVGSPKRISMKFRHEREQHVAECATCHINITRVATLRGLKPDVPITACTECHNKDGLRLDVSTELEALDKSREFVCSYCHTSNIGRLDAPASHYLIAGREPLKRKDLK